MEDEMQEMKKQGESIARTKTEIDIENHVLQATVKLSDGSEGRVFSRSPRNKDFLFSYSCHICGVPCLVGERMLQIHMAGRRHQARLNVNVFDAEQYRASLVTKPKPSPGTDGTSAADSADGALAEGENKPAAQLQGVLDGYRSGPLVGLEYIIEVKGNDLTYQCALCDIRGNNESGITTHIILPEHRIKFLEKHYPTVMKHLAPYRNRAGADAKESVFCRVVQTVCEAIEDHHGRMTPQAYEGDDFFRNRTKYIQAVKFGQHFDEHTGPKFVELIDKKVLQDLKSAAQENPSASVDGEGGGGGGGGGIGHRRYRNRNERGSLDSISSLSSANSVMSISSSGDQNNDHERLRKRSPLNRSGDSAQRFRRQPVKDSKLPPSKMAPTPAELSRQAEQLAHERYKWEKYRCTVDLAVAQLTKQMKEYEKNPEKHPKYSEEWKMFWNRRYKELQAEKKDPQKHNFKPEWIEYWTKRMKDLHDEEVQRKKLEVRTKLNLTAEEEDRTNELREQYTLRVPPSAGATVAKASRTNDSKASYRVSDSEDEADYKGGQPHASAARSKKRAVPGSYYAEWEPPSYKRAASHSRRSRSPISDDDPKWMYRGTPQVGSKRSEPPTVPDHVDYDEWAKNYYGPNNKVFVRTDFDARNAEPINFISVFRLLTALEDYLGSLGPKVIDLLSKGLALEKVKANSADDLLLNEDNSMFLETVKEKLKGHMMAGTIDLPKTTAIKKAIQNIASLLHEASKREPVAPKPAEEEVSRDSLVPSESGAASIAASSERGRSGLDKTAIAGQLAKALVAQGKTDFSTEELEQLINVYIAMVEMSRERKTIITTKTYLTALPAGGGTGSGGGVRIGSDSADDGGMMHREQSGAMIGLGPMFDRKRVDPSAMKVGRRVPEVAKKVTSAPIAKIRSSTMLENISDSDLQTLLKNFKDLVGEEQMHLISYLRKLERSEPERVERLRHYVDFDSLDNSGVAGRTSDDERNSYQDPDDDLDFDSYRQNAPNRQSPSNHRNVSQKLPPSATLKQTNLQLDKQAKQAKQDKQFMDDSEDDEDYSYDDILRAASKNVSSLPARDVSEAHDASSNQSQRLNVPDVASSGSNAPVSSLADTNNLVANLMESLQKSFSDASNKGTAGSAGNSDYSNPILTIGSLGGNGAQGSDGGIPAAKGVSIPAINTFGTNGKGPNASAVGPFYQQQPNMQAMMQQQQMAGAFGQHQQMSQTPMQPFGQQFMYQGQQPFAGNMNGGQQQMQAQQQAAQFGYGNYGGYY